MRDVANVLGDGKKNHMGMTLGDTRLTGLPRWVLQLRVAFGIGCFVVGAACVICVVCTVPFILASDAAIPATFGGLFLWVAFRLLRQVRWHND
jgi:hypothetical protein